MTAVTHGWDASHYDWGRGPMNLAKAKAEGIGFFTHKATDGDEYYRDPQFTAAMVRAFAAKMPVIGAYHVLHPNNVQAQADWFIRTVDDATGGRWKNQPFLWQLDAELFNYFKPNRKPTIGECNAFCDRVRAVTGMVPIGYLPNWLYGAAVRDFKYPLWSSSYTSDSRYPGDDGWGWKPYGGKNPIIWQYTSSATIAGQKPSDANVFRGTVEQLQRIIKPVYIPGKPIDPGRPVDPPIDPPSGGDEKMFNTSLGKDADQDISWDGIDQITWDKEWGDPQHVHADGNNPGYIPPLDGTVNSRVVMGFKGVKTGDRIAVRFQEYNWPEKTLNWWEDMRDVYTVPAGVTEANTIAIDGTMLKGVVKGKHYYVAVVVRPGDGNAKRVKPQVVSGRWFTIQS